MNKIATLLSVAVSMLLCACGIQVQLQTLEPSSVNLQRGTSLRVTAVHHNYASTRLEDALYTRLAGASFYSLGGCAAILYIEHAHVHQHRYIHHTCDNDHHCTCTENVETTLDATVQLELGGQILYRRSLSDTSYSEFADYDALARDIVRDLIPRTVSYSVRIKPQEDNVTLEHAARACKHGDWLTGRSLAESSLQTHPNDPEAYYLLGIIECNERHFSASDSYFRKAVQIKPCSRYSNAIRDNVEIKAKEELARRQLNE